MSEPRRSLDSLITRYELEPELKDIYVEGIEDKYIIEGILGENGIDGVAVFDISFVDVPLPPEQESSNRTRVIELAEYLSNHLCDDSVKVMCVVDSDFHYIISDLPEPERLVNTDYANMEMYFLTSDSISKINNRCLKHTGILDKNIEGFLYSTLTMLFLIRFVNLQSGRSLTYLSFEKHLSFSGEKFCFDREEYIKRYLNKNGQGQERAEFIQEVNSVKLDSERDPRCYMHGHDFLDLMVCMLNTLVKGKPYKRESVFALLKTCADYEALACEPLFSTLITYFG